MNQSAFEDGDKFQVLEEFMLSGLDLSPGDTLEIKNKYYTNGTFLYTILYNSMTYTMTEDLLDMAVSDNELQLMSKNSNSPIFFVGDELLVKSTFSVFANRKDEADTHIRLKNGDKICVTKVGNIYEVDIALLNSDGSFDSNVYHTAFDFHTLESYSVVRVCTINEPKNNDGRDTCYWCGAKTKDDTWFFEKHKVCTKCGR